MKIEFLLPYVVCSFLIFPVFKVCGICTFPSPFANSTWYDNTRGTVSFNSTNVSGWGLTVFKQLISTWICVNNASSKTLIMRSSSTFTYSSKQIYAYICLSLTEITNTSYYYYQKYQMEANAGQERVKMWEYGNLTSGICDDTIAIPALEFHVLVKTGFEAASAIQLPDSFQFSADYYYTGSDGTVACNTSVDSWDMCTNTSAVTFNNSTCSQPIAFSSGGSFWAVAAMSISNYTCVVVYNRDTGVAGDQFYRFSCICLNGTIASVAPHNCTSNQVPTEIPTEADGTTKIGHLLTIQSKHKPCVPANVINTTTSTIGVSKPGLSGGAIAGIVIGIVAPIILVIVIVILYQLGHCHTIRSCVCDSIAKIPRCKVCRKNGVVKVEMPIPKDKSNGTTPHVETVEETGKSANLRKENTILNNTSRTSPNKRQKSDLDKSLLQRPATMTSIGFELRSEKTDVTQITMTPQQNAETSTQKKTSENNSRLKLFGLNLSFILCCPEKKTDVNARQPTVGFDVPETSKPGSKTDKKQSTAANTSTNADKAEKYNKKESKTQAQQTEKMNSKENKSNQDNLVDGEQKNQATNKSNSEKVPVKNGVLSRMTTKLNSDLAPQATSTPIPGFKKKKRVNVLQHGAALMFKPKSKPTNWTLLMCCHGNRSPTADEEKDELTEEHTEVKPTQDKPNNSIKPTQDEPKRSLKPTQEEPKKSLKPTQKEPKKSLKPAQEEAKKQGILALGEPMKQNKLEGQDKGQSNSKPANKNEKSKAQITKDESVEKVPVQEKPVKRGEKGISGNKNATNLKTDVTEEDMTMVKPDIKRSKTMPEREKTVLSVQDAEKVKVDVYVPNDQVNLKLKDTVTVVKRKSGQPKLEKFKTDIPLMTPPKSASSADKRKESTKITIKKEKNGKAKSGNGKKSAKKKKKR